MQTKSLYKCFAKLSEINLIRQIQIQQIVMSISQPKISADPFSYGNYRRNNKKNIIMNKSNIDSGYPQDILNRTTFHKNQDYVEENKKNLKNFFKDRIPHEEITKQTFKIKTINLDPARIFFIKRQQHELKNQTKMLLNSAYLDKADKDGKSKDKKIKKISQIFMVNDKTLQLKMKFNNQNVQRFDSYVKDNHRRGTRSYVQKRSKIIKSDAYEKVFGPDISSISRTLPMTPKIQTELNIRNHKTKSTIIPKKGTALETMENKREELSRLIRKIDDFKNKIKPVKLDYRDDEGQKANLQKSYVLNIQDMPDSKQINSAQNEEQKEDKQKLFGLIENITNIYKGHAIEDNRQKITSLQDLQRLDSKFYAQLNLHKKNRMQKRMYELYKHSAPDASQLISSNISYTTPRITTYRNLKHARQPSDVLTITEHGDKQQTKIQSIILKRKLSVPQRFRSLAKHLITASLQAQINMVKHNYVYPAFWEERQSFQMQGSYAFFKAIKFDDFEFVQTFLKLDMNYLYQIQTTGKTPLIYACLHNKQNMIQHFLSLGSNVDKQCSNKKTALFYALQNRNLVAVKLLLQYGAYPWSNDKCPFNVHLKKINSTAFDLVFSNAKKIYLAVKLQDGYKKRSQFWHRNKHLINQVDKIQF